MKILWLIPLALPLMAASPPRQLSLAVPSDGGLSSPASPPSFSVGSPPGKPAYEPAPLPNRDLSAPQQASAPAETHLAPTLFTQREQFRGDGYSPGSTAQSEQEHRLRPGAGISLHMPLESPP
jgi:hypothetical protein